MKIKEEKKEKVDTVVQKAQQYGIDIGENLRKWFSLNPETSVVSVARKLKISKVGLYHRMNSVYYGNPIDLLELSLLLRHDFITPLVNVYKNKGNKVEVSYTEREVELLKSELESTKNILIRTQREVDKLYETLEMMKKS